MQQPALQQFLLEMRAECTNLGTICTSVTSYGSHRMFKLHVWVDWSVHPLVSAITMGFTDDCLLMTGTPSTRKWHVVPESKLAHCTLGVNSILEFSFRCIYSCLDNVCSTLYLVWYILFVWKMGLVVMVCNGNANTLIVCQCSVGLDMRNAALLSSFPLHLPLSSSTNTVHCLLHSST